MRRGYVHIRHVRVGWDMAKFTSDMTKWDDTKMGGAGVRGGESFLGGLRHGKICMVQPV
jgi:hypothetical protein